jgi:hypothetical protein
MAAKAKENRAQRNWLKTQMFEIWEVVKSSPEEVEEPSLGVLSTSMRSFSPSAVPNSHNWCYMVGLRQIEINGKKLSFYQLSI